MNETAMRVEVSECLSLFPSFSPEGRIYLRRSLKEKSVSSELSIEESFFSFLFFFFFLSFKRDQMKDT